MADGRTNSSGYIVTGVGSSKDWRTNKSGFIEANPDGNANPSIPVYSSPAFTPGPPKTWSSGIVVKRSAG